MQIALSEHDAVEYIEMVLDNSYFPDLTPWLPESAKYLQTFI